MLAKDHFHKSQGCGPKGSGGPEDEKMLFSSSLLFSLHFSFFSFVICVIWVVWIFSFCALVWEYFSFLRHQDVLASESQAKIIEGNKILQFSSQKKCWTQNVYYVMPWALFSLWNVILLFSLWTMNNVILLSVDWAIHNILENWIFTLHNCLK